jgi:hypothetical protein
MDAGFSIRDAWQAPEPHQRVFAAPILGRLRKKGCLASA